MIVEPNTPLSLEDQYNVEHSIVLVQDVVVEFDGFRALDIKQFGVLYNELRVVIGPNGAGKTTLCDVISGKTRVKKGHVFFDQREITLTPDTEISRRGVGRKFQTPTVFDSLTVYQNMELALPGRRNLWKNFLGKESADERDKIMTLLNRVHLAGELHRPARYLSHGQRQWLEISMLIVANPKLLLVDEPAAGLTDQETALTAELLLELKGQHSIMVIEHDMDFVRRLNSRVTVLDNGKVLADGTLDEVQKNAAVIEAYLGRQTMLSISNLSFSYGSVQALEGINMEMPAGQVTCVMGRNGVGKTTLMKNIVGTLRCAKGAIKLGEQDVTAFPPHKRVRSGVGVVPQGRQIFPKLTVLENLHVGCSARADGKRIVPEELFTMFPILKTMSHRMGGDLSGGQQQQLAIARALVGEPKVLLLDEPTEGIQPNIIQQIGHVLRMLVTERKMTIVLVEQYLDFVREFGQRFYIMNRGRVVSQGEISGLTAEVVGQHLSV